MKSANTTGFRNHLSTLPPMRRPKVLPPFDRLARPQKLFPDGPVGSDARDAMDYDRGDR
jgi:hypothetical protein